jgi:hypothetical protein
MCGAMTNDAFDLRWWSLDQALIWISSRDSKAVVSGASWVHFRADRLGVLNQETGEQEYEYADFVLHPQEAEQQLLRDLKNGKIDGFSSTEKLEPIWFDEAEFSRNEAQTLLVNWHLPTTVQIKTLLGGGEYIQRINPDENKLRVRVPSAQALACFPAQEQTASTLKQKGSANAGVIEFDAKDEALAEALRPVAAEIRRIRQDGKLPPAKGGIVPTDPLVSLIIERMKPAPYKHRKLSNILNGKDERANRITDDSGEHAPLLPRFWPAKP